MKKLYFILITIFVFALEGYSQVQVGYSSQTTSRLPVVGGNYSYTQQLYYQDEIDASGNINSISFYLKSSSHTLGDQWTIYMGQTDKVEFSSSSDWISVNNMTEVYSGAITYPNNGNLLTVDFLTPFSYDNTQNLVIAVERTSLPGFDVTGVWEKTNTTVNRAIEKANFFSPIDTSNPGTATNLFSYIPNIIIGGIGNQCIAPFSLTEANITDNSVYIDWSEYNDASQWEIEYGEVGFNQGDGVLEEDSDGDPGKNITGLSPATTYDFYIRSVCAEDSESNWVGPKTVTTTGAGVQIGDETAITTLLPIKTIDENTNIGNTYSEQLYYQQEIGMAGYINSISFKIKDAANTNGDLWTVYLGETNKLEFSSTTDWVTSTEMNLVYDGEVMYPDDDNWMTIVLDTPFYYNNEENLVVGVKNNANANNQIFVNWRKTDTDNIRGMVTIGPVFGTQPVDTTTPPEATDNLSYIPNIVIGFDNTVNSCISPSLLVAPSISTTSVELNWVENGEATEWELEYGEVGFVQGEGSIESVGGTPTYNLTNLNPATNYEVYVRAICENDNQSEWIGPLFFTTVATGIQVGSSTETTEELPVNNNESAYSYSQQIYLQSEIGYSGEITSVSFYVENSLPPKQNWSIYLGTTNREDYIQGPANDWVSPDELTQVYEGEVFYPQNGNWLTIVFDTPFTYDNTGNLVVAVKKHKLSNSNNNLAFRKTVTDDLRGLFIGSDNDIDLSNLGYANPALGYVPNVIFGISIEDSCPYPVGIQATDITSSTADITWTQIGDINEWEIEYGEQGFIQGEGTVIEDNDDQLGEQLTSLTPYITYEVYVRSICPEGETSIWTGPISFTTEIGPCLEPSDIEVNNLMATSAAITWTENGGATQWQLEYGEAGFTPGTGSLVPDNDNELGEQLTELTPETSYEVYVRSFCGNDGVSSTWAGPKSFTTGVLSLKQDNFKNFTYYPNPIQSDNKINLKAGRNIDHIILYDMLGHKLMEKSPAKKELSIDVSMLSAGNYFVKVTINHSSKAIRILKQ